MTNNPPAGYHPNNRWVLSCKQQIIALSKVCKVNNTNILGHKIVVFSIVATAHLQHVRNFSNALFGWTEFGPRNQNQNSVLQFSCLGARGIRLWKREPIPDQGVSFGGQFGGSDLLIPLESTKPYERPPRATQPPS
jgi:hypothetical protein